MARSLLTDCGQSRECVLAASSSDIVAVPWVGYVEAMQSSGLWNKIIDRIEESGYAEALEAADKAFDELGRMERKELAQLIIGDQYETCGLVRQVKALS
ncbi:MAG: hypothetical protein CM1200mP39_07140 [Dehalococcoidia bacterium]|nr:MAG: hypothetical protein CM1200mP39_07140 [Dehalococcoidia bacterium]